VRLPTVAVTFCQPREARINFESALRVRTAHVVSLSDHFIRKTARSMRVPLMTEIWIVIQQEREGQTKFWQEWGQATHRLVTKNLTRRHARRIGANR
jgi:hypothetical protein